MRGKIIKALQKATGIDDISLEFPEYADFGDYSTNVALVSGKKAEDIVKRLKEDKSLAGLVKQIEIAGGGFINFFLAQEALINELRKIIQEKGEYGKSGEGKGKTVVIDYSSPNIAKRFGIGHLRSTVIGQALYNLYKFLGYQVIGDNHLGDWGTQFGTLLYQIDSKGLNPEKLTVDTLEKLYVEFNSEAKDNEALWQKARSWFKKLEEGDPQARKIWQKLVDVSLAEFDRIYQLLGVKIDYAYGESFYEGIMPSVIEDIRKQKLSKKSQGAEIVEFKDLPPVILVKSDGATTYLTRDLATIKFRLSEWNPDLFIYEVGADQTLHFRQLFEIARLLGWDGGRQFIHVAHGLIRYEHGKMSTRRGQTIKLEDVLDEAIKRAKEIIDKSETGRGLSQKEKEEVAKAVGIGAVKYFDLLHQPQTDIIFDWQKIFVLEGNSGPYLQYTVARTNSVLAKAKTSIKYQVSGIKLNAEELSVLRALVRFPEMIEIAAKNYSPNLLANYLFDLAKKYNNFYDKHRILGSDNLELRLALTHAARQVLKNGLAILGIETPERM
ncbi:MAG: arginine--tRNA ligase [Patescibacteria group bacterium]